MGSVLEQELTKETEKPILSVASIAFDSFLSARGLLALVFLASLSAAAFFAGGWGVLHLGRIVGRVLLPPFALAFLDQVPQFFW